MTWLTFTGEDKSKSFTIKTREIQIVVHTQRLKYKPKQYLIVFIQREFATSLKWLTRALDLFLFFSLFSSSLVMRYTNELSFFYIDKFHQLILNVHYSLNYPRVIKMSNFLTMSLSTTQVIKMSNSQS